MLVLQLWHRRLLPIIRLVDWLWLWLGSAVAVVGIGWGVLRRGSENFARPRRTLRQLLWLSVGLKGVAIGLMPIRSEPLLCLALLLSLGLVVLEFGLLYRWLYPLERRLRHLELSRAEYLRLRVGAVYERVAPLVLVGVGLLTLLYVGRGHYRQDGAMGVVFALLLMMTLLMMGGMLARTHRLPPCRTLTLSEGIQSELRRLAHTLGIPTPELVIVDGRRLRSANAYALPSGRIAITDYLMANLSERELLAVLAHEVAHLAQRPRLVRVWLLVVGLGVGLSFVLAPLSSTLPEWSLLLVMALLTGLMSVPMLWLRQRHEREADTFAVSEYGVDALRSALLKTAELNHRRTDSATPYSLLPTPRTHMSLQQRLEWLARLSRV